ncbi:ABC transporter permease [Geobacillus thermoleovorans]|uniref:ABC transporter permease n=1 Tax=Geobacillus proteiniphilus TaxID=860353 RepID=A0A1Q5SMS8_9BACL|nr:MULTISPECIES: ABC transporter permease [Geobacillus]KDE50090.1 ABC transporter [Geobacillus sp. CAMR5420]OKO89299.1 ABC transporter, permease protein EscB [Geobacillus proteiniphilus]OPX04921.1 ABC transporter [Geobacillus sp. LEMMY01]QDY72356.1 ABC transporter permease [Geobacillus thermoleovorans]WMJ15664.1 ABC transporter permease [Geobacillus proteiniphilus]
MIDARRLWKQRFQAEWRKRIRYLRYMFNDHLLVGLIIVLGGIAVMYERWAAALPDSFPYPAIAAVVFGWAAAAGSVRTLFREADTVFLLPAEERLGPYIQRAFLFSWLWQAYGLSLLLLLAGPLHARFSPVPWPLFLLGLFCFKGWSLWAAWKGSYIAEPSFHRFGAFARFSLAAVFVYLALAAAPWPLFVVVVGLMAALSIYLSRLVRGKTWKWERIIAEEQRAATAFYRLANLFTDVPEWREAAKRRRWLDPLLALIPYDERHVFFHLYARTFLRAGGYAGLYVRLTAIGSVMLAVIDHEYGRAAIAFLFLYATAVQLAALPSHHRYSLWPRLYPLPQAQPGAAAVRLLSILLIGQNTIFHLVLLAVSPRLLWLATWLGGNIWGLWTAGRYVRLRRGQKAGR